MRPALVLLLLARVSTVSGIGSSGTNLAHSTLDCSNNICSNGCTTTSCSPSACTSVSNSDLAMAAETIDYNTQISGATCNSACTASSAPICSALSSIFIGTGIKAAYCTDQFLVIHTTGYPNHANWLAGVPRPPGGDGPYESADVVRTMRAQYQTYKIPLTVTASSNPMTQTIQNKLPSANLPLSGAVGVMLSGVPIYPALDNADILAWAACESDQCNAHAGKGFDYHYHGDPYGSNCMYSDSMYPSDLGHPMLTGFAMDGYLIFGRYTSSSQTTNSIALDDCGGHTHGDFGYHYHAHIETGRGSNIGTFTAYWNAPRLCWKGDVSQIPTFWQSNNAQVNYDNTFTSPKNTISSRNDYCFLRPCCGTTTAYAAEGITVHTDASGAGQTTACTSSMSGTSAAQDGSVGSAKTAWKGTYTSGTSGTSSGTSGTSSGTSTAVSVVTTITSSASLSTTQQTTAKTKYSDLLTATYASTLGISWTVAIAQATARRDTTYTLTGSGTTTNQAAYSATSIAAFATSLDTNLEAALTGITFTVSNPTRTGVSAATALHASTFMCGCMAALCAWWVM